MALFGLGKKKEETKSLCCCGGTCTPDTMEKAEEKKLVADAMKQLKLTDAAILRLKYLQGFSNEEVAEILEISEVAVRKRLERARNRFRKILENLT